MSAIQDSNPPHTRRSDVDFWSLGTTGLRTL